MRCPNPKYIACPPKSKTPRPQALIEQHRGDAQLESQARAVEYGQMFRYGELRSQLLEHMPPLDAAAYARSAAAAGKLESAPAELVRAPVCSSRDRWSSV
jgi:hypothetical protein